MDRKGASVGGGQAAASAYGTVAEARKEALYLRYYENLSLPEIAEVMGVNRQSVANFLQKALLKLRSRWALPVIALFNFLSFFSGNRV